MIIWHETIIPRLCYEHLEELYTELCKRWETQNLGQFTNCPLHLCYLMNAVQKEWSARNYSLFLRPQPLEIEQLTDEPIFQLMRELKIYVPSQSLYQQRLLLVQMQKQEGCECKP